MRETTRRTLLPRISVTSIPAGDPYRPRRGPLGTRPSVRLVAELPGERATRRLAQRVAIALSVRGAQEPPDQLVIPALARHLEQLGPDLGQWRIDDKRQLLSRRGHRGRRRDGCEISHRPTAYEPRRTEPGADSEGPVGGRRGGHRGCVRPEPPEYS